MMFLLFSLLPCLLAVAAGQSCSQLRQCEDSVSEDSLFAAHGDMLAYVNDDQVMDTVCGELSTFSTCVDTHTPGCSDKTLKDEMKAIKDIIAYMCTPDGRALVLRLAESSCVDSVINEVQLETLMNTCLETFQFDVQMEAMNAAFSGQELQMSALCPFVDRLKGCLVRGSSSMCGEDMGTFIGNVWDICARDQFSQFGCTGGLTTKRRSLKKALPMLLKRSAAIKKLRR